jgi:hypothetical protein
MKVRIERTVHESCVYLILNYIKLLLVSLRRNLTEILRYFCFAKGNHSLIFKVTAKGHFYKSFVRSNTKDRVIVIKLSFECFIRILVI